MVTAEACILLYYHLIRLLARPYYPLEPTSENVEFDENTEWELEVFDQLQMVKRKNTELKGKTHVINTLGWERGNLFCPGKI